MNGILNRLAAGAQSLLNSNGAAPSAPPDGTAPSTGDATADHFSKSSSDLRRDGFLGAALVGTCTLPYVGSYIGLGTGTLAALTGYSAIREGMRSDDTREVLNGVAHLTVGATLVACGLSAQPLANALLITLGVGTLVVKSLCDHPLALPSFVAQEGTKLAQDGFQGAQSLLTTVSERRPPQNSTEPPSNPGT